MPPRDFARPERRGRRPVAPAWPRTSTPGTRGTNRSVILMSDPRVAAIPLQECGEGLVDVRAHGLQVDDRKLDAVGAFAHVRRGVLTRLLHAQSLLPTGVHAAVRGGATDRRPCSGATSRSTPTSWPAPIPDWQAAELREAASRFVSPPEIAPHSAGAAVDVTLTDHRGRELDMGTPVNANPEESNGACYTDAPQSAPEPGRTGPHSGARCPQPGWSTTRPSGGTGAAATGTGPCRPSGPSPCTGPSNCRSGAACRPPFLHEERSVGYTRADWSEYFTDGRGFQPARRGGEAAARRARSCT